MLNAKNGFVLLLLFVFGSYMCSNNSEHDKKTAQNIEVENLMLQDTNKINTFLECASTNRNKNIELAESCVDSAILLSTQVNFKKGIAKAVKLKGDIVSRYGLFDDALNHYKKSLDLSISIDYEEGILNAKMNIADAYSNLNQIEQSIRLYEELLLSLEGVSKISPLVNLSTLYNRNGNIEKAQSLLFEGEKLTLQNKDKIKDKYSVTLCAIYNGLGNIFDNINDGESAIYYFRKAIDVLPEESSYRFILYNNMASAFLDLNQLDSARHYHLNVIEADAVSLKTKSYAYTGICDLFIEEEDYNNAIKYAERGLDLIKDTQLEGNKSILLAFLSLSYLKQKQFEKAVLVSEESIKGIEQSKFVKQLIQAKEVLIGAKLGMEKNPIYYDFHDYLTLRDSFRLSEVSKEIQNLQVKYETEKTEQELLLSNKEKQIAAAEANRNLSLFLTALLVSLGIGFFLFRERKLKQKQIELKNEAIKSQKREEALKRNIAKLRSGDNHRTDNAFRRTLSELERQARTTKVATTKIAINKARSLINTSKVIHNILRKHEDEQEVNISIASPLKELCASLNSIFVDKNVEVDIACDESINISQRAIQPLFLIIEELFTNAWKHAFEHQPFPKIKLKIEDMNNGFVRLSYKDNGKGLPHNIDFRKEDSEGLELIRHFSRSIGGEVSMDGSDGLQFDIDFEKERILV